MGAVPPPIYAAGTCACTSGASGAVCANHAVAGTCAATSGASGAITVKRPVSGTCAATSGASGAVAAGYAVSGTCAAVSSASGAVKRALSVSGTCACTSGSSGAVKRALAVSGTCACTSGASGAVCALHAVGGTCACTSGASGAICAGYAVSGTCACTSGASGTLELPPTGAAVVRTPLKILDASENLVGMVLAAVRWTTRLNGAYQIESAFIPQEQLLRDGTKAAWVDYIDTGWYLEWDGYRYVVETADGDLETGLTVQAVDAATELNNFYCTYSPGPATFLNRLSSEIGAALVAGIAGRALRNPGFGILNASDLPTNWTHPTGWASALVGNRRVWQSDAGTEESVSDLHPCTPGIAYRFKVDALAPAGMAGTAGLKIRWRLRDGSTSDSVAYPCTEDGTFHTITTDDLTALGDKYQLVLYTSGTNGAVQFDDVRAYEIGPATGYTFSGGMDSRLATIPFTDGAIVKYGVWAEGGGPPTTYLESTAAGDYIGRICNGPFVTVNWIAGGAGSTAKVRINGVQYEQSGSTLVPGTTPIDTSGNLSLTAQGLDPTEDHIVEVEVGAVKTRFASLTVSTDNLISMRYDVGTTVYEALGALQKAVGGEIWFDTVAKVVHHDAARGQNLKTNNVCEFRRGKELTKFTKKRDRVPIVNRLTGLGYGEGQYQLVVTVDGTGTNSDGLTSFELWGGGDPTKGIRRGTYTNKDCKSLNQMVSELQAMVAESQWEGVSYTAECLDSIADLCAPGDTGHFVYNDVNVSLRILEISRANDGSPARLTVGSRSRDLADLIVPSSRQLSTLQKSFQGVPAFTNSNFNGQFERTSGGVDTPADCLFFVPYGADLIDLRLRYSVDGMRAFAKAASSGGGSTSGSGGSSTPTSSAGGSATPTSSSVSTPSGGGSTSGASSKSTADSTTPTAQQVTSRAYVAPSRYIDTTDTWYTVGCQGGAGDARDIYGFIYNHDSSSQTFTYQFRSVSHGGSVVYGSYNVAVSAGTCVAVSPDAASTPDSGVDWFFQVKIASGSGVVADAWISATENIHYEHTHGSHGHGMDHTHTTPDHTHPAHDHTVTIGTHTHTVTIGTHTHSTPDHTHTLDYGIYESDIPDTVRVYLDAVLIAALNDSTFVSDFDLLPYIAKDSNGRVQEGHHTLSFKTATNGDTGSVQGLLFVQQFLSTEGI